MNRKLHNTLMAVIASSSLLTLGLVAGTPVMPSLHAFVASEAVAGLDEVRPVLDGKAEEGEHASSTPAGQTRVVRGNRQSVSMPFFSFVPRG